MENGIGSYKFMLGKSKNIVMSEQYRWVFVQFQFFYYLYYIFIFTVVFWLGNFSAVKKIKKKKNIVHEHHDINILYFSITISLKTFVSHLAFASLHKIPPSIFRKPFYNLSMKVVKMRKTLISFGKTFNFFF